MANWEWVDELIFKPYKPKPELPEDVLFLMLKKQPLLQDLINHFELQMEL